MVMGTILLPRVPSDRATVHAKPPRDLRMRHACRSRRLISCCIGIAITMFLPPRARPAATGQDGVTTREYTGSAVRCLPYTSHRSTQRQHCGKPAAQTAGKHCPTCLRNIEHKQPRSSTHQCRADFLNINETWTGRGFMNAGSMRNVPTQSPIKPLKINEES